jgi:hypothetical protein
MEPLDQFTANEAMQILVIHHKHPEYEINLSLTEVKHLELSVIDDYEDLSNAYIRMLNTSSKLDLLASMSNNIPYL